MTNTSTTLTYSRILCDQKSYPGSRLHGERISEMNAAQVAAANVLGLQQMLQHHGAQAGAAAETQHRRDVADCMRKIKTVYGVDTYQIDKKPIERLMNEIKQALGPGATRALERDCFIEMVYTDAVAKAELLKLTTSPAYAQAALVHDREQRASQQLQLLIDGLRGKAKKGETPHGLQALAMTIPLVSNKDTPLAFMRQLMLANQELEEPKTELELRGLLVGRLDDPKQLHTKAIRQELRAYEVAATTVRVAAGAATHTPRKQRKTRRGTHYSNTFPRPLRPTSSFCKRWEIRTSTKSCPS